MYLLLVTSSRYASSLQSNDFKILMIAALDSKVHGANMGPIWGRQDPGGPHVGPHELCYLGLLRCLGVICAGEVSVVQSCTPSYVEEVRDLWLPIEIDFFCWWYYNSIGLLFHRNFRRMVLSKRLPYNTKTGNFSMHRSHNISYIGYKS